MESVISKAPALAGVGQAAVYSKAERVALCFFALLFAVGCTRPLPASHRALLFAAPLLLAALWRVESAYTRPWTRVVREFTMLGLILAGYWSIQLFAGEPKSEILQRRWVEWDRTILHQWGLQGAIEWVGRPVPFLLECVYLSLYTIPPIFLSILFLTGARKRTQDFLFMTMLGTLTVYASLPVVSVESPRIVFPGMDLPTVAVAPRAVNTWLLDHMDISTSVFPSGHCAVAFSNAFGILYAVPKRRRLWTAAFAAAIGVYVATIYGRYHYAVDGLASVAIVTALWLCAERLRRRADA